MAGERGLVRCPAGADDQPAAARCARGAERERLRRQPYHDPRANPARDVDVVVEDEGPLGIGFRRRIRDELRRLLRDRQPQLPLGILEDRAELDELRDQRA
jgi:hypothetical protein